MSEVSYTNIKVVGLMVLAAASAADGANSFRVTPYVQHLSPTAMTIMWVAQSQGAAKLEC